MAEGPMSEYVEIEGSSSRSSPDLLYAEPAADGDSSGLEDAVPAGGGAGRRSLPRDEVVRTCSEESPTAVLACSPALETFAEDDDSGHSSPSSSRPRVPTALVDPLLNYGSEDEPSDGDDGPAECGLVPRSLRLLLGAGEDAEDDSPPRDVSAPTPVTTHFTSPTSQSIVKEVGPTMFDFQWRVFPDTPAPPAERREPFSEVGCGPTKSYTSPYDAFMDIWDRRIVKRIVVETNRYARQTADMLRGAGLLNPRSRITQWTDTDVDEMYVFFAIIISMGIVVKSRITDYWTDSKDIFSTPGFGVHMNRSRFQMLCRLIHFNDNANLDVQTVTRPKAKLYKLQPIIDHLNDKFSTLYKLSQNIALDESLAQWKGWCDIDQFIPNKVAGVGIKTYEVCESQTGYLWRFEVCAASEHLGRDKSAIGGSICQLVLRLLRGLEFKGYTVWMEGYYNSPALARTLKSLGFDVAGTLRTNRQSVPVQLAALKKARMAPGEISGCTSGDVDLVVWSDKKRVALISTYHGISAVGDCGSRKPSVVADYNVCMGGVDKKDQMMAAYPIERKRTRVWYKKFFRRLLNASIVNSFIMYGRGRCEHLAFRKTLVMQLLERHQKRKRRFPSGEQLVPPFQPSDRFRMSAEALEHLPACYVPTQYEISHTRRWWRGPCVVCRKRTGTYCPGCNAAVCAFTCHRALHY